MLFHPIWTPNPEVCLIKLTCCVSMASYIYLSHLDVLVLQSLDGRAIRVNVAEERQRRTF